MNRSKTVIMTFAFDGAPYAIPVKNIAAIGDNATSGVEITLVTGCVLEFRPLWPATCKPLAGKGVL